MPVYEYRCASCGTRREDIQPMGAPPPPACDACGSTDLRRVYGRVGVRFSGWGFRSTDKLVPGDRPKKDFKTLSEKAQEIADG
jgi:putative FmdB family regulatory protein